MFGSGCFERSIRIRFIFQCWFVIRMFGFLLPFGHVGVKFPGMVMCSAGSSVPLLYSSFVINENEN